VRGGQGAFLVVVHHCCTAGPAAKWNPPARPPLGAIAPREGANGGRGSATRWLAASPCEGVRRPPTVRLRYGVLQRDDQIIRRIESQLASCSVNGDANSKFPLGLCSVYSLPLSSPQRVSSGSLGRLGIRSVATSAMHSSQTPPSSSAQAVARPRRNRLLLPLVRSYLRPVFLIFPRASVDPMQTSAAHAIAHRAPHSRETLEVRRQRATTFG
jgi:hypothetical protein